jgi:hypothetical protein
MVEYSLAKAEVEGEATRELSIPRAKLLGIDSQGLIAGEAPSASPGEVQTFLSLKKLWSYNEEVLPPCCCLQIFSHT